MYKLMMVDRDEEMVRSLSAALDWKWLGVEQVIVARDGPSALGIARAMKPELILTSASLPGMSGFDWISLYVPEQQTFKLAYWGDSTDLDSIRKAFRFKALDYLPMPVNAEALKEVVARMVRELESPQPFDLKMWLKARELLRKEFVESLLEGSKYFGDQTFSEHARLLQLDWLGSRLCVLSIELDKYEGKVWSKPDKALMDFAADNVLQELSRKLEGSILLSADANRWICVIRMPGGDSQDAEGEVYAIAKSWVEAIQDNTHTRIAIGISSAEVGWRELPRMLAQAREALAFKGLADSTPVHRYGGTVSVFETEVGGTLDRRGLLRDLLMGDKSGIQKRLARFPEGIAALRTANGDLSERTERWIADIHRFLEQYGALKRNVADLTRLRESLRGVGCDEQLRDRVVSHLLHLCDLMNPATGDLIRKAAQYIGSNLSGRLKLADVAQALFVSPDWLGRLFRQQLGMTFLQYATSLKMEEAKLQLRHSPRQIQEIAWGLGYEDAVYFSKLFKQYIGLSPNQYKRMSD